jgi:hypothetical protein
VGDKMKYPRVLIVTLGRINAADTDNNGLLLRNLSELGQRKIWPRYTVAAIMATSASLANITNSDRRNAV